MKAATGERSKIRKKNPSSLSQSQIENKIGDLFANIARTLGQAPSLGSIYGILFISPVPLNMNDLIKRLKISKGSASQGLRQLKAFGAIESVGKNGARSEYYIAVLELKQLASAFLQNRFLPQLEAAVSNIKTLKALSSKTPKQFQDIANRRLEKLSIWHEKALATAPLVAMLCTE